MLLGYSSGFGLRRSDFFIMGAGAALLVLVMVVL
jgi:hypothetical protein